MIKNNIYVTNVKLFGKCNELENQIIFNFSLARKHIEENMCFAFCSICRPEQPGIII